MLTREMEAYVREHLDELKQLVRDLAPVPAPSRAEERRAAWIKSRLEREGAEGVFIDEAKNVIWPYCVTDDNELTVFMAHTDVVFPDKEPLPFREDGQRFYCPGVADDTEGVAVLLLSARYFIRNKRKPKTGILFIANSCEEGLGNSFGAATVLAHYRERIRAFVSVDGDLYSVVNRAVGSHRYRIRAKTAGGHSWGAFGNPNAIVELTALLQDLYAVPLPVKAHTKTTRNVGTIAGGTSVNSIAEQAECLFEYRSDDVECLSYMEKRFRETVDRHQAACRAEFCVELVGSRPCGRAGEQEGQRMLERTAEEALKEAAGRAPQYYSGSTDANIPLSFGIPAVTIGSCTSHGAHTREEYLELSSLEPGFLYIMSFLSRFFED